MVRRMAICLGIILLFLTGWSIGTHLLEIKAARSSSMEKVPVSPAAPAESLESLESLLARVESAPLSEFREIYKELSNPGNANLDRLTARRALLKRWIREDASMLDSLEIQTHFIYSESLKEFTQVWLEIDPSAFFVWMARQEGFLGEQMRMNAAMIAPLDFIAQAGKTGQRPADWDAQIATALLTIADDDPTRAMTLYRSLDLPETVKGVRINNGETSWNTRDDLPSELASILSQTDPDAGIAFARSLMTPEARKKAVTATLATIAVQSLDAGEDRLRQLLDETGITASSLSYDSAEKDLPKALQWVERHEDPEDAPSTLASLARRVEDVETLRELAGQIQSEAVRAAFHLKVLDRWSRRPADLGVQWALEAPDATRDEAMKTLAHGFGPEQFDEAMTASEAITDPAARTLFQERLHLGLTVSDPERALAFSVASGKPALRDAMLRKALERHAASAEYSIGELLSWAGEGELDRVPEEVMRSLGSRYFEESPEAAFSWIESRPMKQRDTMLRSLALSTARENLEAGLAMTSKIENSSERSDAVRNIATELSDTNPERAFSLLSHQDRISEGLLESALKTWTRRDPAAARAALASAPQLSSAERARLETWIYERE